jgi:hypothetical protein
LTSPEPRPRAFITAPSLEILRQVEDVLGRAGFSAVVSTDIDVVARSPADAALTAMKECELVVGVLAAHAQNAAVLVELGMALAIGVRVIVVDEARVASDISELSGAAVIKAAPGDLRPLEHALTRLPGVRRPQRAARAPRPPKSRRNVLPLPVERSGEAIVHELKTVFEQLDAVSVVRETPADRFDLGVWSGALEAVVGNPFLIEVKVMLPDAPALERLLRDIAVRIEDSNVRWAGLVFQSGDVAAAEELARSFPILVFQADELLNELRGEDPWGVFRRSRSERVHG